VQKNNISQAIYKLGTYRSGLAADILVTFIFNKSTQIRNMALVNILMLQLFNYFALQPNFYLVLNQISKLWYQPG